MYKNTHIHETTLNRNLFHITATANVTLETSASLLETNSSAVYMAVFPDLWQGNTNMSMKWSLVE